MRIESMAKLLLAALLMLGPALALAEDASLETRLASTSYWERMRAFNEVTGVEQAQRAKYVPLLVEGLRDSNLEIRLASVRALSGFGPSAEPALPAIVETLEIQNGEARFELTRNIASLGLPAVPALIDALERGDPYVVAGACETLAEIGRPARAALPALRRLVDDERPLVADAAIQAVARIAEE